MSSRVYMAASVPRFLRTTKLAYLPLQCIIGSRVQQGANGNHLIFDVIMLPVALFQRMKMNVGLQHVVTPVPVPGGEGSFNPCFVLQDAKQVIVPEDEGDPEGFAKAYFRGVFKLENGM